MFTGLATNDQTAETRAVRLSEDIARRVTYEQEHATCSGPCCCTVEPDGTCPEGWPSKLRAVGLV